MPKGFRPNLEPPSHRRLRLESRRPCCCLTLTSGVVTLIFAIFAVSGWNLYSHQYDEKVHFYNDGDQVALSTGSIDFSSIFCSAFQVKLEDPGIVYVLPHHAEINQSETLTERFAMHQGRDQSYSAREFYLLQGSRLNILACHENNSSGHNRASQILFIKGAHQYYIWRHNRFCKDCISKKLVIPNEALCSIGEVTPPFYPRPPARFNISITATDHYALVVDYGYQTHTDKLTDQHTDHHTDQCIGQRTDQHTDQRTDQNIDQRTKDNNEELVINMTLTRTLFELRDSSRNCTVLNVTQQDGCGTFKVDLAWNSGDDLVVDFSIDVKTDYHGFDDDVSRTFRTKCQVRLFIWVLIFAGAPALLALPISFAFFYFLCRKRENLDQAKKGLSSHSETIVRDDTSLVHNEVVHRADQDSCMAIQDG